MENKETILKLYNVCQDDILSMNPKNMEITKKIAELTEPLYKTLSKEQIQTLEKISNLECERNKIVNEQVFQYGYSLATKLLVESLTSDTKEKKDNPISKINK